VRLLGAFQDITERHLLEQRVAGNERFLSQLTDSLPLRIAYLDRERRYRFANLELLRHFGRPLEAVVGRTRAELMPDADDTVLGARAREVLAGQPQQFEFEEWVGGQWRRIENRLSPDRDESGAVQGFFVTGIDITERHNAERAQRELTAIIDNTTDFVVQTDAQGRIVYMNPSARKAAGLGASAPLDGLHFADFCTAGTQALLAETVLPALRSGTVWVGETRLRLPASGELPVSHMVIAHLDSAGRVERYSSILRDISAAVRAKQEVQRQTEILHSVTEAIPATVVVVGADGRYRFANSAFERYCGLPRDQILGQAAAQVLGAAEVERRLPWISKALEGETVHFALDYPSPDGVTYLALSCIPLRLESGALDGFIGISQDITQQKREEVRLTQLAQRDPLTGLLNRSGFEQGLELLRAQSGATGLAVLYIDLDGFKPVNDRHGHPAGDRVLETFARRLAALVRPSDLVARLGGDEFAIAMASLPHAVLAQAVADKVLAAASTPFDIGPRAVELGASVGVAYAASAGTPWRELLARADARLLEAKAAGKGRQAGARD
jgi:diguanylate cyclase (GGDEF)-like protein/PAS domain S-box-containing protein